MKEKFCPSIALFLCNPYYRIDLLSVSARNLIPFHKVFLTGVENFTENKFWEMNFGIVRAIEACVEFFDRQFLG